MLAQTIDAGVQSPPNFDPTSPRLEDPNIHGDLQTEPATLFDRIGPKVLNFRDFSFVQNPSGRLSQLKCELLLSNLLFKGDWRLESDNLNCWRCGLLIDANNTFLVCEKFLRVSPSAAR